MADNEFEYKAVGVRYIRSESITFQGKQNWIAYKKKAIKLKIGVEAVGTGLPTKKPRLN